MNKEDRLRHKLDGYMKKTAISLLSKQYAIPDQVDIRKKLKKYPDLSVEEVKNMINNEILPADTYPNLGFTPKGWKQKLIELYPGINFSKYLPNTVSGHIPRTVFRSSSPSKGACEELQSIKRKLCNPIKLNKVKKCTNYTDIDVQPFQFRDMTIDELKDSHDQFMACRNIRAMESRSHCTYKDKDTVYPINQDQENHVAAVNFTGNAAADCVDQYVDRYYPTENYIEPVKRKHRPIYIPQRMSRNRYRLKSKKSIRRVKSVPRVVTRNKENNVVYKSESRKKREKQRLK